MRVLALLGLLALSAGPTFAAEGGKAEKAEKPARNAPGTSVEMPAIISPMNDADGRLAGYAYITCTIIAKSPDVAVAIRAKSPFIQDAFVRDVNTAPVVQASDLTRIDKEAVARRFLADARKVMGEGKVVSVAVTQVQYSSLRAGPPSDVPQDHLPVAGSGATAANPAPPPEKTAS